MVAVGQKAPDFLAPALVDGAGQAIELFKIIEANEAVVLLFSPADFVPACTAEWLAVRDGGWHDHPKIAVFGLTGDSLFSHANYARRHDILFPIISDFHAGIANQYDLVLDEWEGHRTIPARAVVVIDGDWEVHAIEQAPPLAEASPAPVETAADSLSDLGLDVDTPAVEYEN